MEKTTLTLSEHVGEHAHVDRAAPSVYSRLRRGLGWRRFSRVNRNMRDIYRARGLLLSLCSHLHEMLTFPPDGGGIHTFPTALRYSCDKSNSQLSGNGDLLLLRSPSVWLRRL